MKLELEGDYTSRLALLEELKSYPFAAVWDYYCDTMGVPVKGIPGSRRSKSTNGCAIQKSLSLSYFIFMKFVKKRKPIKLVSAFSFSFRFFTKAPVLRRKGVAAPASVKWW